MTARSETGHPAFAFTSPSARNEQPGWTIDQLMTMRSSAEPISAVSWLLSFARESAVTLLLAAAVLAIMLGLGVIVVLLPGILPVAFLVHQWRSRRREPNVVSGSEDMDQFRMPGLTQSGRPRLVLIRGGKGTDNVPPQRAANFVNEDRWVDSDTLVRT
jgi:hypothetical protein